MREECHSMRDARKQTKMREFHGNCGKLGRSAKVKLPSTKTCMNMDVNMHERTWLSNRSWYIDHLHIASHWASVEQVTSKFLY